MSAEKELERMAIELATARRTIETLEREKRKVGLSFHRVPESGYQIKRLWDGDFPYLQPIPRLSYTHADRVAEHGTNTLAKTDGNVTLIEGENLAALAALQLTHEKKVDVIYIDPPYNTGNNDFIYNDARKSSLKDILNADGNPLTGLEYETRLDGKARTVGRDDPERHSLWLSFMEKRLYLAKELLADDGVIFVSIDDNEQARLKVLMDTVFGEENFIACVIASYNPKGRSITKFFADNHEYILVYAKKYENCSLKPTSRSLVKTVDYKLLDERGTYRLLPLLNTSKEFTPLNRPNLAYPIYVNSQTYQVSLTPSLEFDITVYPKFSDGTLGVWRWGKDKANNELWKLTGRKIKNEWIIQRKDHLTDDKEITVKTFLNYETLGTSDEANKTLTEILGHRQFDYPKNIKTLKLLASFFKKKDAVILDFFAGSGTTAHAVAQLNAEDGGSRQTILVTHGDENGKNIAEDVTAERIKRVLSGTNWADGKDHEQLPGELIYLKLLFTPKATNPLSAVETMQTKFIGLGGLEQKVTNSFSTDDYAVLENSLKTVVILTNQDILEDDPKGISEQLNALAENHEKKQQFVVYIPTSEDFDEYGLDLTSEKWIKVFYPTEYLRKHETLLNLLKQRNLILEPLTDAQETIEENN